MAKGNKYDLSGAENVRFRDSSEGLFLRYGPLGTNGKPVYNTSILQKVISADNAHIVFETLSGSWYRISRSQLPQSITAQLQIRNKFPEAFEI